MSATVIRAAQNTYLNSVTGGTRDDWMGKNIAPFVDAVEVMDAPFLNSLDKGTPGSERKEYTGMHGIRPRASIVGTGGALAAATSIPLPTGHGVRFQQGHVLLITRASDNATEIVWVNGDPLPDSLPVKRAQGGTTALAFVANDKVKVIGIAMPQLSNFPLSPVARGRAFWNVFQKFSGHIEHSIESDVSGDDEFPNGSWMERDMLDLSKHMKRDLQEAIINGRRQEGAPDPEDPIPGMLGGLLQFAELSGNVFNVGGSGVALTIEAVDDALITLDETYGDNAGTRLLMSHRTKQIFNRMLHPYKYQMGTDSNSVDLRWESVRTEVGTFEFNSIRDMPHGVILIYNPREMKYAPYKSLDWREKDVPTQGDWLWKGMSGTFTFRPGRVPSYGLIRNFNLSLAAYPKFQTGAV